MQHGGEQVEHVCITQPVAERPTGTKGKRLWPTCCKEAHLQTSLTTEESGVSVQHYDVLMLEYIRRPALEKLAVLINPGSKFLKNKKLS